MLCSILQRSGVSLSLISLTEFMILYNFHVFIHQYSLEYPACIPQKYIIQSVSVFFLHSPANETKIPNISNSLSQKIHPKAFAVLKFEVSPTLRNFYIDRQATVRKEIGGTTALVENLEDLKVLIRKVKEQSEKMGIELDMKKTKVMKTRETTYFTIDGEDELISFCILESVINNKGSSTEEM